ncbi:hypothetical protein LguiB_008724 [Lonicera macranthoides]
MAYNSRGIRWAITPAYRSWSRETLSTCRNLGSLANWSSRMLGRNKGCRNLEAFYAGARKGRPLPNFGEWDVNNPSSAEGFTVIFARARDD